MTDFNNLLERVEWLIGQMGMTKTRFAKEISRPATNVWNCSVAMRRESASSCVVPTDLASTLSPPAKVMMIEYLFMVAFFLNNAILRPLLSELRKILHGQFGHRLHACADITLGHDSGAVARQPRYEQKVTTAQI